MQPFDPFTVPTEFAGQTLAAVLRRRLPGQSWSQVRKLVESRRVTIDGSPCMDAARRLKEGEVVECLSKAAPVHRGATVDGLVVRYLDDDVVVVEKASGISTVRHPAEREWDDRRRELSPTLDDLTQKAIAERLGKPKHLLPRLRIVHRLDKETSGLVVFTRSVPAGAGPRRSSFTHIRSFAVISRSCRESCCRKPSTPG